jgi:MarR family transcriptional regulator, negative regulator of the multidrug operon emrRAB
MADFTSTEHRLVVTCRRYPAFPRGAGIVARLIKHIHKLIHEEVNVVLKPYGTNHPEYNVLMMMYGTDSGTVTPSELAEASGEKSANITRLTDQLSAKGWIARASSPDDRRMVELTLTSKGLAVIERFLPDICDVLNRQGSQLYDKEQVQLEKLLKKMLTGLID